MKRIVESNRSSLQSLLFLALTAGACGVTGCYGTDAVENEMDAVEENTAETSQALRDKLRRSPLSTGSLHSLARTADGRVLAWGSQTDGQLGNGVSTLTGIYVPQYVKVNATTELRNVVSVAAGFRFSMALTSDGKVYTWGKDDAGQIGNGAPLSSSWYAVQATGLSNIVAIAAGQYHALALTANGMVYAWGESDNGRLGAAYAADQAAPVVVNGLTDVVAIAAGSTSSHALKSDGTVWSWGNNGNGQLGNNTTTTNATPVQVVTNSGAALTDIVAIRAGEGHVMAVAATGSLYAWGANFGALSVGASGPSVPAAMPVKLNSSTYMTNVVDVAVGKAHTYMLLGNGSVMAVGDNASGQLGTGNTTNATYPQAVLGLSSITALGGSGGSWSGHSLALSANGSVYGWGNNGYNQVGVANTAAQTTPVLSSIPAAMFVGMGAVDAGGQFGLLLKADGNVLAWGSDSAGQLGNGASGSNATPGQVTGVANAVEVAAGDAHALALLANGSVMAWGNNVHGQLGVAGGSQQVAVNVAIPANTFVTAIAAGKSTSFALTSTGSIHAWGGNDLGQRGDGTVTGGATLSLVNLPAGNQAIGIGAGEQHGVALMKNGNVMAWGNQVYGRVGNGSTAAGSVLSPVSVQALDPGNGATIDLQRIVSLSVGGFHTLALDDDGNVWAWGYNSNGQIGNNTTTNQSKAVRLSGLSNVIAVAAGRLHSYAVTAGGAVYGWGAKADCQLTGNATGNALTPTLIGQIEAGANVVSLSAGTGFGVVMLDNAKVYAFGDNTAGQLGPAGAAGTDSCSPLFVTQ